ncbi:GGDEF domain-containing protein [Colwellia sp. E2M01]|uniref:GGDEF domain-containing protein n=1 Tax=Colwellia sp. E2M01 TaxID=2841561 RepID=UPI001C0819DA|nr:GGDEF domain-containing protein [Colwellia sp. E2M01]MBU2871660.1 GGDEF domain-containing protein [Colwellia sp. E2M01]
MNKLTGSKKLFAKMTDGFKSIKQKFSGEQPEQAIEVDDEINTMICPVTGALNRLGLRSYFDHIVPSEFNKMSLIFIELDYFHDKVRQFSTKDSDKYLQQIVTEIIETCCGTQDLLARWSLKELVLACPDKKLTDAVKLANKVSTTINKKAWPTGTEITCTAGAAQANGEDLHYLINHAKAEILKAKKAA